MSEIRTMWLILFLELFLINEIKSNLAIEVQDLTENFLANLNADPLLINNEFSEKSVEFINQQTENYIALMKKRYGVKDRGINKRSVQYHSEDFGIHKGKYSFQELSPWDLRIAKNASDIFFIQQKNNSYVVVLEKISTNNVMFYKQNGENLDVLFTQSVGVINKLVTYSNSKEIFVILCNFTGIFVHTVGNNNLKFMQKLKLQEFSDIIVWENTNGLFLSVVREQENSTYTSTCLIYKWLGRYFDQVNHEITTYGSRSVTAFSVGSLDFMAIANYQDDEGQPSIYSEIFKYNIDTERYEPHQKLLTNGAVDILFFSLKYYGLEETYLVVANSEKNENHIESIVNSIIYKYVDKYFIPFQSIANRANKWIVTSGAQEQFFLISISKSEGVRAFTYDGWKFVAQDVKLDHFQPGIVYGSFQKYMDNIILKLTNENFNNGIISLYKLDFVCEEDFKTFEEDTLKWCVQATLKMNDLNFKSLSSVKTDKVKEHMNKEEKSARHSRQFGDENIEYEKTNTYLEKIEGLYTELDNYILKIKAIQVDLKNYLQTSGQVRFEGEIYSKYVVLKKDAFFDDDFIVETINDKASIGILDNIINIKKDYDFEKMPMNFEKVKIVNRIAPIYINNRRSKHLLHKNDSITFHDVKFVGKIILNNSLNVESLINNVDINSNTLLLRTGDQVIYGNVGTWKSIKIRNAKSNFLNKLNLKQVSPNSADITNELEILKVKKLTVSEFLNGKDVALLNRHALRASVSQQVLEECFFENLDLVNLFVNDYLSGMRPEDAFTIHEGEFHLNKDVLFTGDLSAEKIIIKRMLNHLKTDKDGVLPFLLKNTSEEQYVTGSKVFEEVAVVNPLNLQVMISSEKLKGLNPIRIIPDEKIVVNGNFNFTKKVVIEGGIATHDIKASKSNKSIEDILTGGLEISTKGLQFHLSLKQPLNVEYINVGTINDINLDDLVVNGNDVTQAIYGNKIVKSDLHITGSTTITNVNNIYIRDLESKVLNVDDDQEIWGSHVVKELIATSVDAVNTKLGDHIWQDIVTFKDNQTIYGTTVIDQSAMIKSVNANFTDIEGLVNTYDFVEILQDTADLNTTNIQGYKTFELLQVENLLVKSGVDMKGIQEKLEEVQEGFQIEADQMVLPDHILIEKLNVDGHFGRMKSEDFAKNWEEETNTQEFYGNHSFNTVTVFEEATIFSNEISGFDFQDIVENTLKVNESYHFDDVTFKDVVYSLETVTLHGNIPGLDLETIITSTRDEQTIWDLTFASNVDVVGNLKVSHLINKLNYINLCNFSHPHPEEPNKNLIVTGNAYFIKGLSLKQFQNTNIQNFYDDIWIGNRETKLDGHVEFGAINFQSDLKVEGLIDNISLKWLVNNYFSKTKDQMIVAHLDFTDGINFFNGVSAPEILLVGRVSSLDIVEFLRTAILDNVEQKFENTIEMESCSIQNLKGDFLVNNLNLLNDMMRYDSVNTITSIKRIATVLAENLILKNNIPVQNVGLPSWIHQTVSNVGGAISGDSIFYGNVALSKGLGVVEKVNGIVFNDKHILLKNKNQIINGRKVIHADFGAAFVDVSLKGSLNGVNLKELSQNQAYKNGTNLITSEVRLLGAVTANNLNMQGLYNNISISNTIFDMQISQDLNNQYENYAQLLNMSNRIKESLKYQAYYLNHYNIVQKLKNVQDAFYLTHKNVSCLALISKLNNQIEFFRWDELKQLFDNHFDMIYLESLHKATYFTIVGIENEHYLYFEHLNLQNAVQVTIGSFTPLGNIENIMAQSVTPGVKFIHPFALPKKAQICFIFTYVHDRHPDVYCKLDSKQFIKLHQQLDTYTSSEPVTFTIKEIAYIITSDDKTINYQNCITLWKHDANTGLFYKHQKLYITASNSLSTINYKDVQYLAISSGHLQSAQYKGTVEIHRFNSTSDSFTHWQDIITEAPIQVEFAILSQNELVLYILKDNLIEQLQIYTYEGVNGFKQQHFITTFAKINRIKQFNTVDDQYFILAWHSNETILIKSYFKGYKIR